MTHVSQAGVGAILDHYADVIEGGNAYAGGDSFRGIPGSGSNNRLLRVSAPTLTADTAASASAFTADDVDDADAEDLVRSDTPPFFAVCTSATEAANVDAARKITAYSPATNSYTVDAFPATVTAGDVFALAQGFKRLPNHLDIESDEEGVGIPGGFDRFFSLRSRVPVKSDWLGDGAVTYMATLDVALRINRYGRHQDVEASVMENLGIIRSVLPLGIHREPTHTRALVPDDSQAEIVADDKDKIVAVDRYSLIYRLVSTYN